MSVESSTYAPTIEKTITGWQVPVREFLNVGDRTINRPLVKEGDKYSKMPKVSVIYKDNQELVDEHRANDKVQLLESPDVPDLFIVCPSYVEIAEGGYKTHSGSNSKYLAEMRIGNDIFLLSTLAGGEETSGFHFHPKELPDEFRNLETTIEVFESETKEEKDLVEGESKMLSDSEEEGKFPLIEFYDIVNGMAILHHEEGDEGFITPQYFSVQPGVDHRMKAGPKGAVVAIMMKNAALYPPELRHIYPPQELVVSG